MMTAFPFLRQFAAWATALMDSYRFNPFVRATVNVILLQVLLIALTIGVFWWAIGYTQTQTVDSISDHLEEVIVAEEGVAVSDLPRTIDKVKERTQIYVFMGILALASLFGFLVARYALRPARHSLQFQKQFIGNVAHEIRTPMAIIKTNTEVALMDPNIPADMREVFEETITELDRMSETINNLLTFDTLVRPERVKSAIIDMDTIAATVVGRHEELAASRGVALTLRTKGEAYVYGNATALEQVVTNLVKNAVNYTPKDQGKTVEVVVENDLSNNVTVTVTDTGIGIAQKDLYHIFEPFYRADTSRARGIGTGSSGLGLAIVNEIVRLHHGTISIRSALNQGTTIKVTLPRGSGAKHIEPAPNDQVSDTSEVSVDFSKPENS